MSKCLIIVGMHRSGTSYTAGLLRRAGLDIGKRLLGTNDSNERGHFENEEFLAFHKRLLSEQGLNHDGWDLKTLPYLEQYKGDAERLVEANRSEAWGWKEPRTSLLLDFWEQVLPEAFYLCVYRAPWEVTDSLYRRSVDEIFNENPFHAIKVWSFYNETILAFHRTHSSRSLLFNIEEVISEPEKVIADVNLTFGFDLRAPSSREGFDKSLYRANRLSEDFQRGLVQEFAPDAYALYERLEALRNRSLPPRLTKDDVFNRDDLFRVWHLAGAQSHLRKELKWMRGTSFWKLRELWHKVRH